MLFDEQIYILLYTIFSMKLHFNSKLGVAKLVPESLDDLYHISKLVELDDLAGAMSSRKMKKGGEQGRQSAKRKPCFIVVKVEKIELDYASSVLRISGSVENEPRDVPKGSAHSLTIEPGTKLELTKEKWKKHQIDRMNKAKKRFKSSVLVCALDDDKATFAAISDVGIRELGEIELHLASKRAKVSTKEQYENLVAALRNFVGNQTIVLASPGFWKDELFKVVKKDADLAKRTRVERVSSGGLAGVKELVKKGISKESTLEEEGKLVEELQRRIAKNGAVTYGFAHVKKAISAIETLLLSEKFVGKSREVAEKLVDTVEKNKGKVVVMDSRVLDGLGGAAALLRYTVAA
tara:strand:- start:746 stop:1795 length:1050 start_codon:yes stop_codon:yes gene_type:complete